MIKSLFLSLKNLNKTKVTKRLTLVIFVLSILSLTIFTPVGVNAGVGDAMTNVVAWILDMLMSLIGALVTLVLSVLINIAQFNEFTTATAVATGWVLVRDICNMFFIVILLVISVGTVLGIQSYSYKNFLKKVIIMAILINFSKTIAGFLIDLSQIIMLTFVAAFKDSITVGFTEAFGLNKLKSLATSMDASGKTEQDNFSLLLGMMFGLVISFILLISLVAIVAMLAYRIVILWILVVLSPFAYLASAMPGSLGGQAKQWWSMFSEQLIVGPAIAFFLWLTLSIVSATGGSFTSETSSVNPESIIGGQLATAPFLLNYFLGITLLLVGMDMAKKMGGKSGAAMGTVFDKGKKKGVGFVKSGAKYTGGKLKSGGQALVGGTVGAAFRGYAKRVGAVEGGEKEGTWRHLIAARSEDKLKGRQEFREKVAKAEKEAIFGKGNNINAALDARKKRPKKKAINKAVRIGVQRAHKLWNKGDDASDGSGKRSAEEIQNGFMQNEHKKIKNEAKNKSNKEWKGYGNDKKSELMTQYGAKTLDGAAKAHRDKAIENAEDELRGKFGIASGVDLYSPEALQSEGLEKAYLSKAKTKATERAEKKYEKKAPSKFNPMKRFYDIAEKTQKDKDLAERKGAIIAKEPERFTAEDVEDNIGDIKGKATKAMYNNMTTEQVDSLVKEVDERIETATSEDKRKKAEKRRTALYKSLKYLSDEKVDNDASKYYDAKLSSQSVRVGEKSEEIKGLDVKKSTKDYMTDLSVSDKQVVNTGEAIESEISHLGTSEVVLNKGIKDKDRGWQVDHTNTSKNENGEIVLSKGLEKKIVSKEEFVKSNSRVLSEQFYSSDRYDNLKEEKGEENILSQDEYKEYAQIRKSSQTGITMGSLSKNGNISALDYAELNRFAGSEITGEQRGSGMYVNGDEAVRAAGAMTEMVQERAQALEEAVTESQIRDALKSFGQEPESTADLQQIRENTLHGIENENGERVGGVDQMLANLGNKERIRSEGLILLNKTRNMRGARGLIRHETAHMDIEMSDGDGSMQEEVWGNLTETEKESARDYIRTDRNQSDLSEEEIKKEYLADALANVSKSGVRDESKPYLSQPLIDRMQKAGDMKVDTGDTGSQSSTFKSGRVGRWLEQQQMQRQRKLAEKKANKHKVIENEQVISAQEENIVRGGAQNEWRTMNKEDKDKFMRAEVSSNYDPRDDKAAMKIYETRKVKGEKTKAEKTLQTEEEGLVINKESYNRSLSDINAKKLAFAQTYNNNRKDEVSKNTEASNLEKEAAEARKRYIDPNNTDSAAAKKEYNDKIKGAEDARKAAADIAKKNAKLKKVHDKEIITLEQNAQKQKVDIDKTDKSMQAKWDSIGVDRVVAKPKSKTIYEEQIQERQEKLTEMKSAEKKLKNAHLFASPTKKKEIAGQLEIARAEIEGINKDIVNLENAENSAKDAISSTETNRETSSVKASSNIERGSATSMETESNSGISASVSKLSEIASNKDSSPEQIKEGLKDLETQIILEAPESEEASKDNDKFLEELRKLMAKADSTSSRLKERGANVTGGDLGQLLSNVPPGMLNAGQKKRESNKGSITIPKQSAQSFLSKPLSMAQFLQMKKWFGQQSGQMKKIASAQSISTGEMKDKIANLNQRISNTNTEGGDVDMKVILEDADFSPEEIQQIVADYTSQQDDE